MSEGYFINGDFDEGKMGHGEYYYSVRQTWIDARGPIQISQLSYWGFCNKIITQTHDISTGVFNGPAIDAGVIVDEYVWITSFCVLHNCHIGHHAIASAGSIIVGIEVPPYTIVAGNPCKAIAEWNGEKWVKLRRITYLPRL